MEKARLKRVEEERAARTPTPEEKSISSKDTDERLREAEEREKEYKAK